MLFVETNEELHVIYNLTKAIVFTWFLSVLIYQLVLDISGSFRIRVETTHQS